MPMSMHTRKLVVVSVILTGLVQVSWCASTSAREKGPYGMHVRTEKIAFEVQWVKFTVGF